MALGWSSIKVSVAFVVAEYGTLIHVIRGRLPSEIEMMSEAYVRYCSSGVTASDGRIFSIRA